MAEDKQDADNIPVPIYPSANIPTFFADGVVNIHNSSEIVKFYFFRFDPAANAIGPVQPQTVGQAVMSMTGFLQTAAFFDRAVANFLATGAIKPEQWKTAQDSQAGTRFNV
jgi:hypothetical protein